MNKPAVLQWVERQTAQVGVVATVCTGVCILAAAVKALEARTREQEQRIEAQEEELQGLRREIAELRRVVEARAARPDPER